MAKQIFRQEAIDRMASPDRLDQPVQLVASKQWLLLAAICVVLLGALLWSFLVSLPVKVSGQGMLVNPDGLKEIATQHTGRVEKLLVQPGDHVQAGDVVAEMVKHVRQHDVAIALAALQAAEESAQKSALAYTLSEQRYARVNQQRLDSIAQRIADLEQQLVTRRKLADDLRALVEKGAVTPLELVSVVATVDALEESLRQLEQEKLEIEVARADRADVRDKARLQEEQEIAQRGLELQRLQAATDDAIAITAFQGGQVAEVKVNEGDVLVTGAPLLLINPQVTQDRVHAVFYLEPRSGKKVRLGMRVEVVPSTTEKELYGFIPARVINVAALPASREGMQRVLQNARMVDELIAVGAPIQVQVELEVAATPSGFAWSSSNGPDFPITSGTLLEAKVVVEQRAVIDLLLPGLRQRAAALASNAG